MDPSEGNLLVKEVCEDVNSLNRKTERLRAIWITVENTNMDLNNRIAKLQKEISELQEKVKNTETVRLIEISDLHKELDQMAKRETAYLAEISDLRVQVTLLQNEVRKLKDISPKNLAKLKLKECMYQIPTLMYKCIFPDAHNREYTLQELKNDVTPPELQKQYDDMITRLDVKEDFISVTIKNIMRRYRLKNETLPADKDLCEEIKDGIANTRDFEQVFTLCEMSPDDVKQCKLLAKAYLHLRTMTS